MHKIWNLTSANLRKGRGQAASFFVIVALAAMLLNLGVVTGSNYDKNYDRRAEQLNGADVIVTMQNKDSAYTSHYEEELFADSRVKELEVRSTLFLTGNCAFGQNETRRMFAMLEEKGPFSVGQVSYVEKSADKFEAPIYLPYLFKSGGGYQLGDPFTLTVYEHGQGEKTFEYTVAGFFEEMLLATINSTTSGLILGQEQFEELSDAFSGALDSRMFLVQLKDRTQNEVFCSDHIPEPAQPDILSDIVYYDIIKQARTITSTIGAMIIVAFSFLVMGIAVIVVNFRIRNSLEEDMRNIGALKAIGYTGKQISLSILLQFALLGFFGALMGIGASYLLLPLASAMFEAQTGVIWKQGFDLLSAVLTAAFILFAVLAVSYISTRRVRRLQPITALRSGILTHSFRRNPVSLDRCRGPVWLLLAGKSFCQGGMRNVLVGLIVAAIAFAGVFAGVLYDNVSLNADRFVSTISGENADIQVDTADPQQMERLVSTLQEDSAVRKWIHYSTDTSVQAEGGSQIICYMTEDYGNFDNQQVIYQGRFPKHANETAIGGLMAGQLGKAPGDTIVLKKDGQEAEYLITGLIQGSNYLGHDAALTEGGYRRIAPGFQTRSVSVYLNDKGQAEDYIQRLKDVFGESIVTTNISHVIEASLGIYQWIVSILVLIILIITAGIVSMTLYLVVKTTLLRKRKELGIQKAIGYSTRQLVLQTAFSFLPIVLLGSVLGCVVGYFAVNPLLSLLFSGIGVMKVNFQILPQMLAGLAAALTFLGFLISALTSLRIRKISPYALMGEV